MKKLSQLSARELDAVELVLNGVEGAIIIDENGIIRIFTDHYARESDLSKEEVLGKRVDEIFPHTRLLEVLNTGKAITADMWELNDKSRIVSRVPIMNEGEIIGVLGINIFRYLNEARGFATRIQKMSSELKYYKEEVKRIYGAKYSLGVIIGKSKEILEAKEMVQTIAPTNNPVLIYGETGTGKELFAHAIHQESARREGPFVRVNCAGIPDNLIESELFGYEEGAFTGARKGGKPGKFELANHGSIFLDEVSELSSAAQAKLLRALQENEIERVGSTSLTSVDTRVISATNIPLNKLVAEGKFRKDLFFRLNTFTITVPPLREHFSDLPLLCQHFIDNYNQENGTTVKGINNEALQLLASYHWPGNIRELNIAIERACIDARKGILTVDNLLRFTQYISGQSAITRDYSDFDIQEARKEAEKAVIIRALQASNNNRRKAAELLGISRSALYNKIIALKID
ncbi:MAG: sigma 54-interacting transcriptional regulator [Syntrophomonadaceae bacterium]|nr:sigma 54-interacting transcriptional regulator [Syntrophomonadaceae bacterium]MDD4562937.1 sigma 54-interacting transcriptional regulator [Syntrophomonadaceae bacterium]